MLLWASFHVTFVSLPRVGLVGHALAAVHVVRAPAQDRPDQSRGVHGPVLEELLDLLPDPIDGRGATYLWLANDDVHAGPGLSNPDGRIKIQCLGEVAVLGQQLEEPVQGRGIIRMCSSFGTGELPNLLHYYAVWDFCVRCSSRTC